MPIRQHDTPRGYRPQRTVNQRVFRWWDYPLFAIFTAVGSTACGYLLAYWFSLDLWRQGPVIFCVVTFLLIGGLAIHQLRWFLLLFMRKPNPMLPRSNWKVGVVTTFVPGAESPEMLEKTVRALVAMDYPHDTWVLDEGNEPCVKKICRKHGANHFSRKEYPQYLTERGRFQAQSKHGNYNAWLHEKGFDRYEIISAFDPDHVPAQNFLVELLGYFEDPKVAYVQAPQSYYNQGASLIARGAAEETYAYYSSVQMASYGMGYPIIVGCHNTHRVTALEKVGGFAAHDADDLLLTMQYRHAGWQGVYLPQILATGLTPVDWNGYLTQQRRWARSVLDLKLRKLPSLCGNLPLQTFVMSCLQGLNYLYGSIAIFASLLILTISLATGIDTSIIRQLAVPEVLVPLVLLQLADLYRQRFFLEGWRACGLHWRAKVLRFAKWPYLILAMFEVLLNRRFPYEVTIKLNQKRRAATMLWPHVLVASVLGASWFIGTTCGPN